MIPKEWKIESFGKVATFRNGLNFTRSSAGQKVKIVGIPHFWQKNISDNHADLEFTTINGSLSDEDLIQNHDLLFVRSNGNKQLIGRCLLFENVCERISFSGFTIRARLNKGIAFPPFIADLCRSNIVKSQFMKMGGGSNISNLSQDILQNTLIPLPPLAEQKRIAEILSTWDWAIETTEKLIANSEAQKKALMQQLLTGKKRLPGFSGEWRTRKLSEFCTVRRGASPRPIDSPKWFAESGRAWVRISDVTKSKDETLEHTDQYLSAEGAANSVAVDPGDLIMSICATIGVPKFLGIPACIHDGFVVFREVSPRLALPFLFYVLEAATERLANSGQPGTQKNLNTSIVGEMLVPEIEVAEQLAIAESLKRADNILRRISDKLKILKAEKSALMQQLLTGKRRVKIKGEAQAA